MPSDSQWFDQPDDELDEYPDEDDLDDDCTDTVACPNCGAEIYEDAVRCPVCDTYITFHTSVWSGRPVWWLVLGLLGILATIVTLATLSSW